MKGIDVSVYQGKIDWKKVAAAGVGFAIIRTWIGSHEDYQSVETNDQYDRNAEINYQGALAAGIPAQPYMLTYMRTDERALREAEDVIYWFKTHAVNCRKIAWWDFEDNGALVWSAFSKADILRRFQLIDEKLKGAGIELGIYTSRSHYWDELLTDPWYDKVHKWVASYPSLSWARPWAIHQYSSSGSVEGIAAKVDMNDCREEALFSAPVEEAPGGESEQGSEPTEEKEAEPTEKGFKKWIIKILRWLLKFFEGLEKEEWEDER